MPRTTIAVVAGLMLCAGLVGATPLCSNGIVITELGGAVQGPCQVPGTDLILSGFQILDTNGNLFNATVSFTGSSFVETSAPNTLAVNIMFNPNLAAGVTPQDIYLRYDVYTSGWMLDGVDLLNNGSLGTSIHEKVCNGSIDIFGNCTPVGGVVADMVRAGGNPEIYVAVDPALDMHTTFSVWKDIYAPAGDPGGHITSFTESYHFVPEPATYLLMGFGLFGLGLVRRYRRRSR